MRALLIWAGIAAIGIATMIWMIVGFNALQIGVDRDLVVINPIGPDGAAVAAGFVTLVALTGVLTCAWWRARRPVSRIAFGIAATLSGLAVVPGTATLIVVSMIASAASVRSP